ncbi:MAG: ATP-binding cassette domain-containing protein [Alphaproteobacteria bacterium]|nr:ATP-binding cassette domain-containing protein [Alphaproteobacteria bacterium]
MAAPLLLLQDIHLTFGGTPLLEGAELSLAEGERLCLVGRNGSGKSTLLKIAAGLVEFDRGGRVLRQGATVRYLPQEPDMSGHGRVLDYVTAGLAPGEDPHRARHLLERLGLTGEEAPGQLSGGEARRAALARCLAPEPDILLLDEPTNHLDLPAIEWLEEELAAARAAMVLISHDRRFLDRLARATVWLDRGQTRRLEQGFAAFEGWRDDFLAREETARHRLDRRIARETDWLRHGISARRTRNQGRVRALAELRRQRREARRTVGELRMSAGQAETSGRLVIEAEQVKKRLGGRVIVRDLSLRVMRGDRLGIVGANGAGKTTLLQLLTGRLAPDEGRVRLGAGLEMVFLDQSRASLDPAASLRQALAGDGDTLMVNGRPRHVMSYLQDFLFAPEQAGTPIGRLSGGERGRLMLARALARPSNLLVLDEPTNDLDLETLDLLQEMLGEYEGTVLLVSHDRDFLDRTVTSVLAHEGDGRWTEYAGGYSDMLAQRAGAPASAPTRQTRKERTDLPARPAAEGREEERKPGKRRLGFRESHALKTLPGRIAELEGEIATLQERLADPGLYGRDPASFGKLAERLAGARAELAVAEEEWLRLEMLREEIEG